jgi:RNA-directed DNA polymerase
MFKKIPWQAVCKFLHVVSKVTFAKNDHAIFQSLWRWAKRRHPYKPPGWIRQRYFTHLADNR